MKYTEEHQIEYYECDENGRLKIPAMIDLLMQVSEHQLQAGDAGTAALLKKGLGWVVTQYHFEIDALPHPGQKITLTTNAAGYNRFFEYRDFGIETLTGKQLVSVRSQWVMFDLKKRHLTTCDEELMKKFNVPLLKKMPRFPRLRALADYDIERRYRVRYDDLDTNHHLTNSHYFNWLIDMLDRNYLKKYLPAKIDIKFDKEVRYGQVPSSCMKLVDKTSYHAIKDEKGNEQAVCEIVWQKA